MGEDMNAWRQILPDLRIFGGILGDLASKIGDQKIKSAFDLMVDAFFEYVEGIARGDERKVDRGKSDFFRLIRSVVRSDDERVIEAAQLLRGLLRDVSLIESDPDEFVGQMNRIARKIVRLKGDMMGFDVANNVEREAQKIFDSLRKISGPYLGENWFGGFNQIFGLMGSFVRALEDDRYMDRLREPERVSPMAMRKVKQLDPGMVRALDKEYQLRRSLYSLIERFLDDKTDERVARRLIAFMNGLPKIYRKFWADIAKLFIDYDGGMNVWL